MPVHIRQIQIQQDQIVVIELCQIDALFPQIGGIGVQIGMGQHQFDAFGGGWVIFDQQYSHVSHSAQMDLV